MSWYSIIDMGESLVFSPKVMPDPEDTKRLDEQFKLAVGNIDRDVAHRPLRIVAAPKRPPSS